jgi:PAS domain S-box-containing protein
VGERIWIDTMNGRFGWLDLVIADPEAFAPYAPYVRNLAVGIALHAETSHQQHRFQVMLAERERIETELRSAHERVAALARFPEENPDPVIRLSGEFTVMYANEAARAAFGPTLREAAPAFLAEPARRALTERRSVRVEIPNGDRVFSFHFAPRGPELNVYAHDVSGIKRAEKALLESEGRYRTLFESIDEGFCIIEVLFDGDRATDYRFLEVNPAFERQTGIKNAAGRRMREIAPEHEEHWFQIYGRIALTGEPRRFENPAEALGRFFDVYAFRTGAPEQRRVAILFTDISERKRAEAALEEANARLREADRRKNDFLGMLSHELRNPLAPIRNSLYILSRAQPGGEQARRALAVIERQVQQTAHLVDDLLDVTRITGGKIRLRRERVELQAVARHAVEDHRDVFAKNGVRLEVVCADEPVVVEADPTRIAQVIGNLLQNAVKFTPRGGQTTVSVERHGGSGVITVRDTGAGIAPDVAPRLFEPFMQAETTLDRSAGGLGLGLALVKGLVELHGGSVSAQSEGLGKGATFVIQLPLETRSAPRLAVVPAAPRREPKRRVLLIEDNIDSAETLKEALELNDHAVEIALTGTDGLEKARSLKPDVIVCDIGLPGMDGFHVAREIRADPDLKQVPLIALSGYAQQEDLEKARQAGFDEHVAKPPDLETLIRMVAEIGSAPAGRAPTLERNDPR